MMTRTNLFCLVFTCAALFVLSACQTGGGYGAYRNWDSGRHNLPAEEPPKPLSDAYAANRTQPPRQTAAPTPQTQAQPDLPPVKIALLLPLSGQHANLGQSMLNASQIALFDIGHQSFELLPHDTKGTPEGAREAARTAVREGAELVLGPVFASSVRAAKSITSSANVNMIAFSTDWQLAGGNTFIMGFLPFDQVERVTTYAAAKGINNVAVIAPQTDYGQAVISAYQSVSSRHGIYTSDTLTFPPNSTNLAPTLRSFTKYDERILQARAEAGIPEHDKKTEVDLLNRTPPFDAVLMPVGGEMALSISNLLSHYDLPPSRVKRLGTGLLDDLGVASENSLNGAWFAAPSPELRRSFENRYIQTYGGEPPRLASLSYDATALAAILAQRGLQTHGTPLFDRQSITNPNGFSGIDGIFRFRPNGTAERGLAVLEIRNGRIEIIDDAPRTFQHTPF